MQKAFSNKILTLKEWTLVIVLSLKMETNFDVKNTAYLLIISFKDI